jgi:uncharacterized protein (TIGR02246 family)
VSYAIRAAAFILALSSFVSPQSLGGQSAAAATPRAEIQQMVRDYMDAHNRADATAMMELVARRPEVSSVSLGEITRGWEAIRVETDEMTGQEGRQRYSVGTMDVTMLGATHALVVAPTTIAVVRPEGEVQLRGAMTLVLVKQPVGWRILNEHFSIQLPQ